MKTAISLPDPLFERAERTAKRRGISRSQLYRQALEQHLDSGGGDEVTEALDRVYGEVDSSPDPLLEAEALRQLAKSAW